MTELRDARFKLALEHAPDAQELPGEASRRAIRAAARTAVTPAATAPWWRRWWTGGGGQRTPWSAAFASVLLASLVTVLWWDHDVPDAAPQAPRMEAPARSPAPAVPAPAPAPQRKAADAAREKAAASRAAETQKERRAEPPPLAKSAPAPQAEEPRRADVAGVAPPAPAPAAAAAAPAMRSQFTAGWNHLRIEIDGRSTDVLRGQSLRLDSLVDAMAAFAGDAQPLEAPVVARIVTLRDGQPHGVLELAPPRIRWAARGGPAFTAQPDPAQLQALLDELARLGAR